MSDQNGTSCKINDFGDFLEKCLRRQILNYKFKPLTKPGDNYGSVILSVEVKVTESEECEKDETLHLVAKTAVTNPYLVKLFQPAVTFVKEAHFYSDIIPAIENFEQSEKVPQNERISAFIRCLGSRFSLDPTATRADNDAVMLFENIKLQNYKNCDQRVGFDTKESMEIIKQLAKFHSLCIAMKIQQPKLFDSKIRPYTNKVKGEPKENDTSMVDNICNGVRFIENLDQKLRDKVEEQLRTCYLIMKMADLDLPDTPYTTLIHRDFWSTNVMIKTDNNIEIKFYDFQMFCLGSFAVDLVLFLFTSVRSEDLTMNFKSFINQYHSEFEKMMKILNCSLDEYTFEKMWDEIEKITKGILLFILYIVKIIFLQSEAPSTYDEVPNEMFLKGGQPSEETLNRWKLIIDLYNEHGFL